MTRRNIYIDDNIWKRLKLIAKRDGANIAEIVRRAIVEFLKREEMNEK